MKKVAFPTEDGKTISRHFGQAPWFLVATIEEGKPIQFEKREKYSHTHRLHQQEHEHENEEHRHASMFAAISDCQVLIAGGMGQPAYDSACANRLEVILSGERSIEAALEAYLSGKLSSDLRRIHAHHAHDAHVEVQDA